MDTLFKNNTIQAVSYDKVGENTPVINTMTMEYHTYVKLPIEKLCDVHPYQIFQINPRTEGELIIGNDCKIVNNKPWLDIITDRLDLSVGKHVYRISCVNTTSSDCVSYYFSYEIQDDCPDKSYDYMKRDEQVEVDDSIAWEGI